MPEYAMTENDYRIKYGSCYAKIVDPKWKLISSPQIVQIGESFHIGKEVKTIVRSVELNSRNLSVSREITIPLSALELKRYQLGVFNLAKSCILIHSKQPGGTGKYRLLPHPDNIKLFDPFSEERQYLNLTKPKEIFNFFVLEAWDKAEYPSASQALDSVMNHTKLGCAFTNNYYFGISFRGDSIFLYKDTLKIARVNNKGQILLKPEVHCLYEQLSEHGLNVQLIES